MQPLEQVRNEVVELKQTTPIKNEIEGLGFRVIKTRAYEHQIFRCPRPEGRGYDIHLTLDDLCLTAKQLESIMKVKGFEWISIYYDSDRGSNLEIYFWRKEIA